MIPLKKINEKIRSPASTEELWIGSHYCDLLGFVCYKDKDFLVEWAKRYPDMLCVIIGALCGIPLDVLKDAQGINYEVGVTAFEKLFSEGRKAIEMMAVCCEKEFHREWREPSCCGKRAKSCGKSSAGKPKK